MDSPSGRELDRLRELSEAHAIVTRCGWHPYPIGGTIVAVTALPRGRALTRADLEVLPDDGHRYELVDGVLLVTPAPVPRHQLAVWRLGRLIDDAASDALIVLPAPVDVVLADDTVLEPDLVVVRRADVGERGLTGLPLLAVEVLSPSTRRVDLLLKRARCEAAGVPSYWVVDPDEPSVLAWRLAAGGYIEDARAVGTAIARVTAPFPMTVCPAALVAL